MAQKTNSFERFWKELKRRKVVHVITVYAAVAFVIMQVVDMVAEPLRLPDSTKALVIVLLCIGFIIAVFVSWVYDITPAGVYAFLGNKIKAYENLRIYNQRPNINLWIRRFIKYDPLFGSIRNEPEFQQIVTNMEAKYQTEHERVKKWLEQQGMLN